MCHYLLVLKRQKIGRKKRGKKESLKTNLSERHSEFKSIVSYTVPTCFKIHKSFLVRNHDTRSVEMASGTRALAKQV